MKPNRVGHLYSKIRFLYYIQSIVEEVKIDE